ncbi:hypothetical protein BD626DRAFT_519566 [Schizophyllum amplum]|uniref:Fungal STAND N-terminal Goodbye domain-containing protein n=1 Tax=Schizophyllum amplum TaxID=97359 RepID=A0A550BV80_9AGAR|nr:hypothetical protein BD626DRAFT_519566 [Auriculariopsis ampla]
MTSAMHADRREPWPTVAKLYSLGLYKASFIILSFSPHIHPNCHCTTSGLTRLAIKLKFMTNLHHDQPHVPSHDDSHAERSTLAPRSYVVSTTDSILVPDQTVAGCAGEYHSASSHPTSAASSASSDTASARTQHSAPIDPLADLWKEAIERYEHNTGVKLIPSRDVSFDSTNAVLGYIQHHEADFKKYRADGPQKLRSIIKPIAATVQTLCGVVGEAVSMVCSPAEAIFTALNVVIQASRQVTDDFDAVADAFDTMEHHLRMVGSIATAGDMHEAVREASVKLLAQLLVVLGTVTNLQKHNRLQLWWKKVQQSKKVSSALDELGRLATNHHQTVSVVTLSSVVNAVDMLVESRDWDKRGRDESQARHEQLTSLLLMGPKGCALICRYSRPARTSYGCNNRASEHLV